MPILNFGMKTAVPVRPVSFDPSVKTNNNQGIIDVYSFVLLSMSDFFGIVFGCFQ